MAEIPHDARRLGPVARMLGRAAGKVWSLPAPRNAITVQRGIEISASDGVTLLADHYAPVGPQTPVDPHAPDEPVVLADHRAPTVLVRTPYGRGMPMSLQNGQIIAGQGYHVLLVSCRGTFGSGGEFDPGRHEAADGQACVDWLREQEWFDGRLGTFGISYLGFTQWALAMDPPPELRAVAVLAGLHDFGKSAYRNGAFSLYTTLSWADMVANQETGKGRGVSLLSSAERRQRQAMDGTPIGTHARAMLGDGSPWFDEWMARPDITDRYWAPLRCGAALERLSAPALLIGGWQDTFLGQTLEQYRTLAGRGVPTRMVIGPWTHIEVTTKGGGIATREALAWLDRYLRSEDGLDAESTAESTATGNQGVRVWFGSEGWRDLPDWPPPAAQTERWPLLPGGVLGTAGPAPAAGPASTAGLRPAGRPAPAAELADAPPRTADSADVAADGEADGETVAFRYDPALPTPTVGGAILPRSSAGVRDNRVVEERPDVLVFTSAPLTEPLVVAGEVAVEVRVSRDNPNADLFARLCDVHPDGRSLNLCDGIVRLTGADPADGTSPGPREGAGPGPREGTGAGSLEETVRVPLIATAHRFAPGHRLRVQVSGGAHPRFARNPGTGRVDASAAELRDTRYRVRVGPAAGSALLLPVLPGQEGST